MKPTMLAMVIALILGLGVSFGANAVAFSGKKCSVVSNPFCKNR